ncbi:MAG: substrate-binding domain-containing protein [Verrucomicrobia bacterium]|nr:substrate-binding domain-containing protein [Verrucomicrobiota bacterium]
MIQPKKVLFLPGYYVREHHLALASYALEAGWILDASMVHFGRVPQDWRGDGIITLSADRADIVAKIRHDRVPAVDMFNGCALAEVPHVCLDNVAIGRMAGEHLIAHGFHDIGYFYYDPEVANSANETERSAGLRQAAENAGRRFHEVAFHQCVEQVRKLPRPLALMAQNDLVGDSLMHRLLEAGIRVPQEVAIIGVVTDRIYCEYSPIPQTVVASNNEYMGYAAAEMLDRLMKGEAAPSAPVMIQPERVIERASTSLLASDHPPTNQALAFVHEHYGEGIDVDDIARHAGLSRHQLTKCFKQHGGESVSRYLLRIRLNHARRLLAESDAKIQGLATDLGFRSAAYFSTVFLQETGLTPAEFRRRARIRPPT